MYSLNEAPKVFVKIEPPDQDSLCNGSNSQMLFATESPTIKAEITTSTSCPAVCQQSVSLVPQETGHRGPSLEEINADTNVVSIQITNVQGAMCSDNNFPDETNVNQLEVRVSELPRDRGKTNEDAPSNFDQGTQEKIEIAEGYEDEEFFSGVASQENGCSEQAVVESHVNQSNPQEIISLPEASHQEKEMPSRSSYHAQPYTETPKQSQPGIQMSDPCAVPPRHKHNRATPDYYYNNNNDRSAAKMTPNDTLPLYHVPVQDGVTSAHIASDNSARYQPRNYQPEISYHVVPSPQDSRRTPRYLQNCNVGTRNPERENRCCNCRCHSPATSDSFFFPSFLEETQRPSVIMVPINWNNEAPGISHMPLRASVPQPLRLQNGSNYGLSSVDSDSSDDDGEEKQEKYFRMNIDGTTARFKLTKEDWDRIPINTFPSGGRLLSGDWTRIFLSKVKESNPWCSLRFKNNHVRSENSRKMHSAVFFRGGAECKRPECNVKVRFVIQKERGKYVDVTYVGNVCHSSEPGGGDAMTDKRRVKRVRRTYSS